MSRAGLYIILAALLLGGLSGCMVMHGEFDQLKADLEVTRRDYKVQEQRLNNQEKKLNTVENAVSSDFQERFARMEKNLDEIRQRFITSQGALDVRVDEMTNDLRIIQGKLEDNNQLSSELANRLDDANHQIEVLQRRLKGQEGKTPAAPELAPPAKAPAPKAPRGGRKGEAPAGEKSAAANDAKEGGSFPEAGQNPEQVYQLALGDYNNGNFDLAISGFRSYITLFPKHSNVPNAQYWIGECYYSMGKYQESIHEFSKVIDNYPQSPKARSAWLKRGYAYLELGDNQKGRQSLQELLERYPGSEEAVKAKQRLEQLS